MGVFDTFILKNPITCKVCNKDHIFELQSKETECLMATFYQGKKANYYVYRLETPEERKDRLEELMVKFGKEAKETIMEICGIMRKTDEVLSTLKDGDYITYDWCDKGNDLSYYMITIKDGIFIGIRE